MTTEDPKIGLTLTIKGADHFATMGVTLGLKPYVLIELDGDEDGFDFLVEAGGHSFDGMDDVAGFLQAAVEIMAEGEVIS